MLTGNQSIINKIKSKTSIQLNLVLKIVVILFFCQLAYFVTLDLCVFFSYNMPMYWLLNNWLQQIILISVILASIYIKNSFFKLLDDLTFKSQISADELEKKLIINLKGKKILIFSFLIVFVWYIVRWSSFFKQHSFFLIGITNIIITTIFHFTFNLFLLILVLSIIIHALIFPHKIRNYIFINVYHPDYCGGLQTISVFTLRVVFSYFILASLVFLSNFLSLYSELYQLLLEVFLLMIIGIILFIIPQLSIGFLISRYKFNQLKSLNFEYNENKINSNLENIDLLFQTISDFSLMNHLISLKKLPIKMKTLIKLFIITCLPLIILLIYTLIKFQY